MTRWGWFACFILLSLTAYAQPTYLKHDEQIVFYPSIARRVPDSGFWRTEIRGCVFEPEKRRLLLATLREGLALKGSDLTAAEAQVFNERARQFLVDHERGRQVFIRLGTNEFFVGRSGADGSFAREVLFSEAGLARRVSSRREDASGGEPAGAIRVAEFGAELAAADKRNFAGEIFLLPEQGLSVISDIDDTIKVTAVRDRHATLQNTFLREFQPVPGKADFFQCLVRSNDAVFHYVSGSPWQLYEPLSGFLRRDGFPGGTFALKPFRWKDQSFFDLFANPFEYKPRMIEPLLRRFPSRKFILVGDSGERDPEIYGALARKFSHQIQHIFIRDMTGEAATSSRYRNAFQDVPPSVWQVFREPGELKIASQ